MSVSTGLAINIGICLLLGWSLALVRHIPLQVLPFVAIPFASAYLLYWGPVCAHGGDPGGENARWAGLFIGSWAVPGYLGVAAGLVIGIGIRKSGKFAAKE